MTYTIRIPGKAQPIQMEFAKLKNAYADGNVPGKALVTLEHQDFWYSLEELMGDKPTKPLLFPCPHCKQMIRSRMIDRGNPVKCPKCQGAATIPNPLKVREQIAQHQAKEQAKPMVWMGVGLLLTGTVLSVQSFLFPVQSGNHQVSYLFYGLIIAGFGLIMTHWFDFRGRRPPR